jgi:1-acyl-sn-glycerol-3-phosphate acyltransferase
MALGAEPFTATWLLAQLTGTPLTVRGWNTCQPVPALLVANHSSFLDAYVLMAAIPTPFSLRRQAGVAG